MSKVEYDGFVNLHCHDEYSLLDGFGKASAYAARAKDLGQRGIAITNHGNVDGAIVFQNACEAAGVVPIIGCEFYIVQDIHEHPKKENRRHLVALAKDIEGWRNILQMLSVANLEGFYYRPRISPELLLSHCKGLVVMTACASSFIHESWGMKLLKQLKAKIKDDLYLEVMPHSLAEQIRTNNTALALSKEYGIKLVATNDCHYVIDGDQKAQEVLLAVQTRKKWNDKDRWRFDVDDLFVRDRQQMRKAFSRQKCLDEGQADNAIANSIEVFNKCSSFRIPRMEVSLPDIPQAVGKDPSAYLTMLCRKGMKRLVLSNKKRAKEADKYIDRLEEELEIIIRQGFAKYFLIVWELIDWCRNNGIMTGPGRGSAGGSLVCYLLGITTVDPLEFDLLFARFISPARIDLPDIDSDFQDDKRHLVIEHFKAIYGENNVAGVSTFMSMKGRGALRDVSRVFDIPQVDVNKAASSIVVRSGGDFRSDYTIEDAFNTFEDGIKFKKKYPDIVELASKLEGQVRGKGQHAAAVCISTDDLRSGTRVSLVRGSKNSSDLVVNWDKYDIEHVGLMKLDILGLNALTVLSETRKLVKENTGEDIVFEDIPLDDKRCLDEFSKGNNIGCFQFGSLGLRKLCVELGIDSFMMLVHANALFRPGTLRSGMIPHFTARKNGTEEFEYKHPVLEKLTKKTYGIILYQEQVMQFMYDLGGLGWKTADTVRKVISKSQGVEQFRKFKKLFADGCVKKKTLPRDVAEELWDELSSFGSYGFNLSHAVEYSYISYWDMWCKVYYPGEFMCASLTHGNDRKKSDLIEEAIRLGLDVRPPKIGKSDSIKWMLKDGVLYAPFIEIKGIGDKTAAKLAEMLDSAKASKTRANRLIEQDGPPSITGNKKFDNILADIKAGIDEAISEDDAERIAGYFSFSLSRNPGKKYEKIIEVLKRRIKIHKLKDVDYKAISKVYRYYFGQMTEIKFGYKGKVSNESDKGKSGVGNSLGGVYGNLKDDTDFSMLIFDRDIYQAKKSIVEHCAGKFILASAAHPWRNTSISCNNMITDEELVKGEGMAGLKLKLADRVKEGQEVKFSKCEECELCSECTRIVKPSVGAYNVMIVGEAPGKEEDREGKGFVGRSGDMLWKELGKKGLSRRQLYVTNVVKCWPSKTKTPTGRQISKCSKKWLDEEIVAIKPVIILAFGNTALRYFTGEEKGIMARNGTCEWNNKAGAWVCYCIHPASVLYHDENMELFKKGIANFAQKAIEIGGLRKEGDSDDE